MHDRIVYLTGSSRIQLYLKQASQASLEILDNRRFIFIAVEIFNLEGVVEGERKREFVIRINFNLKTILQKFQSLFIINLFSQLLILEAESVFCSTQVCPKAGPTKSSSTTTEICVKSAGQNTIYYNLFSSIE